MVTRTATLKLSALCCECGNTRTVTEWDSFGEAEPDEVAAPRNPFGRCFLWRKCKACGKDTKHAYLRLDQDRDELETAMAAVDVERCAEQILAEVQVPAVVEALRHRGVRVEWRSAWPWADAERPVGSVTWYLSDDVFVVELDDTDDTLRLLRALKTVEEIISDPGGWLIWRVDPSGRQPTARFSLSGLRHAL